MFLVFLIYCFLVTAFSTYMVYGVAPVSGRTNPLVYISICSSVGSISVMSVKAFSVAVKLTIGGKNQFTHPSTYVFLIILVVSTVTQMNYLNKAMDVYPASLSATFSFPSTLSIFQFSANIKKGSTRCTMSCSLHALFPPPSSFMAGSTQPKSLPLSPSSVDFFSTSLELLY